MEGCGWQGYSGFYGTQIKAFARVAFFRLTVCVRRHFAGCCVAFQMLASRQKIVFNYRSFLLQLTSEDSCGILSGRVRKKKKSCKEYILLGVYVLPFRLHQSVPSLPIRLLWRLSTQPIHAMRLTKHSSGQSCSLDDSCSEK